LGRLQELALSHGLHACWSTPIKSADGKVIGTFGFYYRQPRQPSAFHHLLVDAGLHLCAWPSSVKPRARASTSWPSMIR
jgi:GAF domain-containing protein